jgi:Family of unknown function (DUF5996)
MVSLMHGAAIQREAWPELPLDEWKQTRDTLHMWMQIVGKVRLGLTPRVNHWWNVPLYLSPRGLTTSAMPYHDRSLEITFDFIDHDLMIDSSDGQRKVIPLIPRSVADFYREFMACLHAMGVEVHIWTSPVEISDGIPFDRDEAHASYDPEYATRFWQILLQTQRVFEEFRGRFVGKCSPVHFFWGSMDLAVTRFSGRLAPQRPGVDAIQREAYSHECISHGFWPGGSWFGKEITDPIYYSYTVPAPEGLQDATIRPEQARFDAELGEFVMKYDVVRQSATPRRTLMEFLQSTYEAGADRARWDRAALEHSG